MDSSIRDRYAGEQKTTVLSQLTVPEIADKIGRLYYAMRGSQSPDIIAKDINDILICVDKVSISLLNPSWDYFAKCKGVKI